MHLSRFTPVTTTLNKLPFQAVKASGVVTTFSNSVQPSPDQISIRFGSSETPNPDAAAIAVLESLIPRLIQASDWQMQQHQDKFGNLSVGYDLRFTLGDSRYTLRDVYDKPRTLPFWLKPGCILIEESGLGNKNAAIKEYPIDYKTTFRNYWPLFSKVAMPVLGSQTINSIVNQLDQITHPAAFVYSDRRGSIIFNVNGQRHRLDWDHSKGTQGEYRISEESPASPEQLEAFWEATTDFRGEQNAKRLEAGSDREPTPIPTLEEFKDTYKKHWTKSNQYTLTPEQFQQVYDAVKGPIGSQLSEKLGIGEDFNPRPLIRTIAIRLLNSMSISGVGYRDHDDRDEITYYPTQGQEGHDERQALFFEISRYENDDGTLGPYRIGSRGGMGGHILLEVTHETETAILDKVMDIVKTRNAIKMAQFGENLNDIATIIQKINPNFRPKDYTLEKAELEAQEALSRGELTQMLPTLKN